MENSKNAEESQNFGLLPESQPKSQPPFWRDMFFWVLFWTAFNALSLARALGLLMRATTTAEYIIPMVVTETVINVVAIVVHSICLISLYRSLKKYAR